MKSWISAPRGLLAVIGASMTLALGTPVRSETAPTTPPIFVKLPDSIVQKFKEDPAALLKAYQSIGLALSREVRNLVLSDPTTVAVFTALCATATKTQSAAIGAGLAEAAALAAPSDPQLSSDIQKAVLASNIPDVITAYQAATSSTQTAATAGGGLGGGGAAGGATGGLGDGAASGLGGNRGTNSGSNSRTATTSVSNVVTCFSLEPASSMGTSSTTTVTSLRTSTSPTVP